MHEVGDTRDAERGRVFAAVGSTTQTAAVLARGGTVTAGTDPRAAYIAAGVATVAVTLTTLAATRRQLTTALTPPAPR